MMSRRTFIGTTAAALGLGSGAARALLPVLAGRRGNLTLLCAVGLDVPAPHPPPKSVVEDGGWMRMDDG